MRQIIFVLLILCGLGINAQVNLPDNGPLFLQDEVARIDITLPEDSFLLMISDIDYGSTHEFDADFSYTSSAGTESIMNIGFRLRGNTSLQSAKKSFKVSFNTFTAGGMLHGLEKMNLNGEHNDPSILRSKLSWDLLRSAGLPGARTSHVELHINDFYMGLYLNVEHIDEEFVKKRFGPKEGNLFKCLWPADLTYLGPDQEDYQFYSGDYRTYDLKTNLQREDYSAFVHFIQVLNNWSDAEFECEIHRILNVDDYLKMAAAEVLLGHWDGYIVNKNNYYLYENPSTGRMEYLIYDPDNTFGIDWFGVNWAQRNIYTYNFENRPLFDRMMNVPRYRAQYSNYLQDFITSYFNEGGIVAHAYEVQSLIAPYAELDEFMTYDYGFTYDDFLNSIDQGWGAHVPQGIGEYVTGRVASVNTQLDPLSSHQVIKEYRDSLLQEGSYLIRAWTEGNVDQMKLRIIENGSVLFETTLTDQGNGFYSYEHSTVAPYFEYQLIYTQAGTDLMRPCLPKRVWNDVSNGPLFINELMALNSSTLSDESGSFDDWMEIYNAGIPSVYLGNKFLTDDVHCKNKWQLPDMYLAGGDFLLVWVDDDVSEGVLHTNFKLSSNGEELAIYAPQNQSLRRMDYITYPMLEADVSWGRITDGGLPFVYFSTSTPDASNAGGTVGLEEREKRGFNVFPNPTRNILNFEETFSGRIKVLDAKGSLLLDRLMNESQSLDVSGLRDGLWIIRFENASGESWEVKVLKLH
jgi:spore coat protein H